MPAAQRFKDITDLNDFEKKLLEEVITCTCLHVLFG